MLFVILKRKKSFGVCCKTEKSFLYSVLCKCFVAKVKIAHIENRFLVLINELFKPLISIRSSVRAHNIAHVMITSLHQFRLLERKKYRFPKKVF